jgi:hypothetical protein
MRWQVRTVHATVAVRVPMVLDVSLEGNEQELDEETPRDRGIEGRGTLGPCVGPQMAQHNGRIHAESLQPHPTTMETSGTR